MHGGCWLELKDLNAAPRAVRTLSRVCPLQTCVLDSHISYNISIYHQSDVLLKINGSAVYFMVFDFFVLSVVITKRVKHVFCASPIVIHV